jgi:transmembrane sensor
MTAADDQVRSVVSRQASDWYVANQGGSLDHADRAAFVAWLKASPMHVEEYLGVALIARDLRAAGDDPAVSLDLLLEQAAADESDAVAYLDTTRHVHERPAQPRRAAARWTLAAMAASVVLVLAMLFWSVLPGRAEVYRTAHGEQSVSKLPDGSTLHLNTDSEVAVRYSRTERLVELQRGEALFEVMHDSSRPFRVEAGAARVVAVGTRFNVYRSPGATVVTVADGQVDVTTGLADAAPGGPSAASGIQRVGAGYQLRIDDGAGPAQPVRVDLHQALGWLQRKIAFENRPLSEIADEFSRYAQVPLAIDDAALRALPVSGVFDAYDTDSFIAFLQTLDGVRVERTPARILVRRMRTTGQGVPPPPPD